MLLLTSDEVKCTPCIVLTDLTFTTPSRVKKTELTSKFEKVIRILEHAIVGTNFEYILQNAVFNFLGVFTRWFCFQPLINLYTTIDSQVFLAIDAHLANQL